MGGNVPVAEATRDEAVLPERVQEALGELVGAAKEGLLALSVGVGLGVLEELMAEEVDDVVGLKGKWDPERTAVRHGHEGGAVTLGGRRVEVQRPRVRTADGESEVQLETYQHFADRDPLRRVVLERMLAGVSTRRYRRTQEPVGELLPWLRGVARPARSGRRRAGCRTSTAGRSSGSPAQPFSGSIATTTRSTRAFAGRRVEVRVSQTEITAVVLDTGELAARHRRAFAGGLTITDPAHQTELERQRSGAASGTRSKSRSGRCRAMTS